MHVRKNASIKQQKPPPKTRKSNNYIKSSNKLRPFSKTIKQIKTFLQSNSHHHQKGQHTNPHSSNSKPKQSLNQMTKTLIHFKINLGKTKD